MRIQDAVLDLTKEKGKTIKSIANDIDQSEKEILEKLAGGADIELICKICDSLNVSIDELYQLYKKENIIQ